MENLLRIKDVVIRTGIAKSTIWLWVKLDKFPKPIKLSPKITVWKESDVNKWIISVIDSP